jgi:subfamily B ATP-binding cassette protein HlyB/CyaB
MPEVTGMSFAAVLRHLRPRRESVLPYDLPVQDVVWALGSICALHHRPFDAQLLLRALPAPPVTSDALITGAKSLQFRIQRREVGLGGLAKSTVPCLTVLREASTARLALVVKVDDTQVMLFRAGTNQGAVLTHEQFDREYAGTVFYLAPLAGAVADPDGVLGAREFGFRWFPRATQASARLARCSDRFLIYSAAGPGHAHLHPGGD